MAQLSDNRKYWMNRKLQDTPDALRRSDQIDYHEGYFMVTLNVRDDAPILGELAGNIHAKDGDQDAPHVILNELGQKILQQWNNLPSRRSNVTILTLQIMPDHIHGLLHLSNAKNEHLGHIISGFMIGCTHQYWDCLGIDWHSIPKESKQQDKLHTKSFRGPSLFVHGYNDIQAINESDLESMSNYIKENPKRRMIKGELNDRFKILRGLHSQQWTIKGISDELHKDYVLGSRPEAAIEGLNELYSKLNMDEKHTLMLDMVGNRDLLINHQLLPLVCHRSDANRFDEQFVQVIDAARNGAVIVSAFISVQERDIKKRLMQEGLRLIEIREKGFSSKYKPQGLSFYACAENRLLQFSPWKYQYQREAKVSRAMCLAMNHLARLICKCDDDWWKYA